MKTFILLSFLFFISFSSFSQELKEDDFVRTKSRAVYVVLLGNGLSYSFNYDQRFENRLDGLGFKAGASYFGLAGASIATLPVGVNYL